MRLGLRLFFAFFLINGLAIFFVLRVFVVEIKPSVRKVTEDTLVEVAYALSSLASDDFTNGSLNAGGSKSRFAQRLQNYADQPVQAWIWDSRKTSLDLRVTVTNESGRVLFDSSGKDLGADYSQWRDVARTLRGEYGARTTREVGSDDASSVMYVSAPILVQGQIKGVLTVSKPARSVQRIVDRAEKKVLLGGMLFVLLSALVGCVVTWWLVFHVRRLRDYALHVQAPDLSGAVYIDDKLSDGGVPRVPGELGELARAMDNMRARLQGREYIEDYVRALTHELKSPIAAIRASGELLQEELPGLDRQMFTQQILDQAIRLQSIADQLLQLSRLEQRQKIRINEPCSLRECALQVIAQLTGTARLRGIKIALDGEDSIGYWEHDLVVLAISNLVQNAVEFSPTNSLVVLSIGIQSIAIQDSGPGVPEALLYRLGERFFTTPRPNGERSGTGLGLSIVKRIMQLHGGHMAVCNCSPGLKVTLKFSR